jgi:DNA-3-methyladenine glycosylase II
MTAPDVLDQAGVAAAVERLAQIDGVLAGLAARHGLPPIGVDGERAGGSRFEALARAIVYQQLAGRAAATIWGRVRAELGGRVTPETVGALDPERAAACGLSRAKAAALADLAAKVGDKTVRLDRMRLLPDEDVVASLVQVRGIGRWTAEMFLLFTLGRADVWPVTDLGVRVGFAVAWGLDAPPAPTDLELLGEPFRPHRSIVAWYCWRAAEEAPRAPRAPRVVAGDGEGGGQGRRGRAKPT